MKRLTVPGIRARKKDGVTAQPTIPVGTTGIGFTWPDPPTSRPERLGPGSTLTFTNCAYLVVYA